MASIVAVEMHQCHEAPSCSVTIESAIYVRSEYGFDILGIDVLALRLSHIFQAPLDVKPTVLVELTPIARAEPAVVGKDLFVASGFLKYPSMTLGVSATTSPCRVSG